MKDIAPYGTPSGWSSDRSKHRPHTDAQHLHGLLKLLKNDHIVDFIPVALRVVESIHAPFARDELPSCALPEGEPSPSACGHQILHFVTPTADTEVKTST